MVGFYWPQMMKAIKDLDKKLHNNNEDMIRAINNFANNRQNMSKIEDLVKGAYSYLIIGFQAAGALSLFHAFYCAKASGVVFEALGGVFGKLREWLHTKGSEVSENLTKTVNADLASKKNNTDWFVLWCVGFIVLFLLGCGLAHRGYVNPVDCVKELNSSEVNVTTNYENVTSLHELFPLKQIAYEERHLGQVQVSLLGRKDVPALGNEARCRLAQLRRTHSRGLVLFGSSGGILLQLTFMLAIVTRTSWLYVSMTRDNNKKCT